ncbi:MAG: DUF2520 domain-containing protein [Acidobacteriota bacterium]
MSLALLTAGSITHSPISRFPAIVKFIGPVKAPTFRETSRAVNALKGGTPVRSVQEMNASNLFLLCAPQRGVAPIVRDMLEALPDWRGRDVALCSDSLDSRDLDALARRGAHTASITPLEWFDKPYFLLEGHPGAVQHARTIIEGARGHVIEIDGRGTPLYMASADLTSLLLLPLLETATVSLRRAGIPLALARKLVERMVSRSVRNYGKSGIKTWRAPTSGSARARIERQLDSLRKQGSGLSGFFEDSLDASLRFMGAEEQALKKAAGA